MAKRKLQDDSSSAVSQKLLKTGHSSHSHQLYVQIITGSYERVLHGITAAISPALLSLDHVTDEEKDSIVFTDSFLFNAHTSAIKCLALSPIPPPDASSQRTVLATGGTDQRINLYHLSTCPPRGPTLPSLSSKILQDSGNRNLGSLYTHDSAITALHFPAKTKLISACARNILAITSTRDWNTRGLIKAPYPKHINRPTGDTSTASTLPAGINDFAVHPSMKLMISVGRAERCLRLWNLVTGKRAGVLGFTKEMLKELGEGGRRWGSGEAQKIKWNSRGSEFAVVFERTACIFGQDCQPRAKILIEPRSKIHQACYAPGTSRDILALSTEDGRVLFYHVDANEPPQIHHIDTNEQQQQQTRKAEEQLPRCRLAGQLGGPELGLGTRIKDFIILETPDKSSWIVVTASSDGIVRLWTLRQEALEGAVGEVEAQIEPVGKVEAQIELEGKTKAQAKQVGKLLGIYETNNRLMCMQAFVMSGRSDDSSHDSSCEAESNDSGSEADIP